MQPSPKEPQAGPAGLPRRHHVHHAQRRGHLLRRQRWASAANKQRAANERLLITGVFFWYL